MRCLSRFRYDQRKSRRSSPAEFVRSPPCALVYMEDVYAGPGLAGVPRGTVKETASLYLSLRLSRHGRPG